MSSDFLIIGAGAVGLATALELAGRGASVTVLEQGNAAQESTWAGGGILSPLLPWDYDVRVNALSEYSRALFPDWCARLQASSGHDPELRQTGMLVLPPFDHAAASTWCDAHGWRVSLRSSADFALGVSPVDGLWLGDVYQARNPCLAQALRGAVQAAGVRIVEQCGAEGLHAEAGRIARVMTTQGDFSAGHVVLAAGAWSGSLPGLETLARRVFPVRGQMLLFRASPGLLPTVILHHGRYLIPRVDGHVLAGSTLEQVGFDKSTTESAGDALMAFATALVPALQDAVLERHWSGLRPGSPDNIPMLGRHPAYANLYLNTGHYRYGVTMAPGSARLLADLIDARAPQIDPAPYAVPDAT